MLTSILLICGLSGLSGLTLWPMLRDPLTHAIHKMYIPSVAPVSLETTEWRGIA